MASLTAAVIQTNSSDDWRENMSVALELLNKARDEVAAELFVLPENFLCFRCIGEFERQTTEKDSRAEQAEADGHIFFNE